MRSLILPSVMAKTPKELQQELQKLRGVTKDLHLDVADGKFVKQKVLWFPLKLDSYFHYSAHLMIKHPESWIKKYLSKIWLFIPQLEEIKDLDQYIAWMKKKHKPIAFALKPETKISKLKTHLFQIDYLLILTVHPGRYGAPFLTAPLKKIKSLKKINPQLKVIVDGGMAPQTIVRAAKAGADYFVSGSFTTLAEHPKIRIKMLTEKLKGYSQ